MRLQFSSRSGYFSSTARRCIPWLVVGMLAGCGERDRLTFPVENPGDGSGPLTNITRPAGDTGVVEGDILILPSATDAATSPPAALIFPAMAVIVSPACTATSNCVPAPRCSTSSAGRRRQRGALRADVRAGQRLDLDGVARLHGAARRRRREARRVRRRRPGRRREHAHAAQGVGGAAQRVQPPARLLEPGKARVRLVEPPLHPRLRRALDLHQRGHDRVGVHAGGEPGEAEAGGHASHVRGPSPPRRSPSRG